MAACNYQRQENKTEQQQEINTRHTILRSPGFFWPRIKTNKRFIECCSLVIAAEQHKLTAEGVLKRCCRGSSESCDCAYLAKWKSDPCKAGAWSPSGVHAVMA